MEFGAQMREIMDGAATQARVVYALSLRETRTRFGKHRLGYLWALLEPLFWIGTFWVMFTVLGRESAAGMDLIPFLATGVIPYNLCVGTADRVSVAIDANKALLFYPQVQPLDLVYARVALEFATYIAVLIIILGGYSLYLGSFTIDSLLTTLVGLIIATTLGGALGLVMSAASVVYPVVQRIKGPLMRPLFWVSGLFFAASVLPSNVRGYLLWNPILHCTEIVRDGFFPQYHAQGASVSYVMMWILGLAFVGLTLERRVRAKVEVT